MPRLTLPTPETMDAEQRRVHDKIISGRRGKIQGPLRAALHNAELADRWQALGELLRYNTTLTPRQSELAILVTGRACESPFEWYAHRLEAERVGIEAAVIETILARTAPETFLILVFRSMARTAWHELEEAMDKLAARAAVGV